MCLSGRPRINSGIFDGSTMKTKTEGNHKRRTVEVTQWVRPDQYKQKARHKYEKTFKAARRLQQIELDIVKPHLEKNWNFNEKHHRRIWIWRLRLRWIYLNELDSILQSLYGQRYEMSKCRQVTSPVNLVSTRRREFQNWSTIVSRGHSTDKLYSKECGNNISDSQRPRGGTVLGGIGSPLYSQRRSSKP